MTLSLITFDVPDMHCAHCVGSITTAVQQVDPGAELQVDLAAHRVAVVPAAADAQALAKAIRDAGYSPSVVAA